MDTDFDAAAKVALAEGLAAAVKWVCEVLSPSTERLDRGEKLAIPPGAGRPRLAREPARADTGGFAPDRRGLLARAVHTAPVPVRAEPFDAVEIDLGLLFDEPPGPAEPVVEPVVEPDPGGGDQG